MAQHPVARGRWRRDELEFLPAALEIIETPASPAGRAIGASIILFFLLALAWAMIGHVEHRRHSTWQDRPERADQGYPTA